MSKSNETIVLSDSDEEIIYLSSDTEDGCLKQPCVDLNSTPPTTSTDIGSPIVSIFMRLTRVSSPPISPTVNVRSIVNNGHQIGEANSSQAPVNDLPSDVPPKRLSTPTLSSHPPVQSCTTNRSPILPRHSPSTPPPLDSARRQCSRIPHTWSSSALQSISTLKRLSSGQDLPSDDFQDDCALSLTLPSSTGSADPSPSKAVMAMNRFIAEKHCRMQRLPPDLPSERSNVTAKVACASTPTMRRRRRQRELERRVLDFKSQQSSPLHRPMVQTKLTRNLQLELQPRASAPQHKPQRRDLRLQLERLQEQRQPNTGPELQPRTQINSPVVAEPKAEEMPLKTIQDWSIKNVDDPVNKSPTKFSNTLTIGRRLRDVAASNKRTRNKAPVRSRSNSPALKKFFAESSGRIDCYLAKVDDEAQNSIPGGVGSLSKKSTGVIDKNETKVGLVSRIPLSRCSNDPDPEPDLLRHSTTNVDQEWTHQSNCEPSMTPEKLSDDKKYISVGSTLQPIPPTFVQIEKPDFLSGVPSPTSISVVPMAAAAATTTMTSKDDNVPNRESASGPEMESFVPETCPNYSIVDADHSYCEPSSESAAHSLRDALRPAAESISVASKVDVDADEGRSLAEASSSGTPEVVDSSSAPTYVGHRKSRIFDGFSAQAIETMVGRRLLDTVRLRNRRVGVDELWFPRKVPPKFTYAINAMTNRYLDMDDQYYNVSGLWCVKNFAGIGFRPSIKLMKRLVAILTDQDDGVIRRNTWEALHQVQLIIPWHEDSGELLLWKWWTKACKFLLAPDASDDDESDDGSSDEHPAQDRAGAGARARRPIGPKPKPTPTRRRSLDGCELLARYVVEIIECDLIRATDDGQSNSPPPFNSLAHKLLSTDRVTSIIGCISDACDRLNLNGDSSPTLDCHIFRCFRMLNMALIATKNGEDLIDLIADRYYSIYVGLRSAELRRRFVEIARPDVVKVKFLALLIENRFEIPGSQSDVEFRSQLSVSKLHKFYMNARPRNRRRSGSTKDGSAPLRDDDDYDDDHDHDHDHDGPDDNGDNDRSEYELVHTLFHLLPAFYIVLTDFSRLAETDVERRRIEDQLQELELTEEMVDRLEGGVKARAPLAASDEGLSHLFETLRILSET